MVYKDGTISVANEGKGHPLLLGAAQDNLKTWRFKPNDSPKPIPIDIEYEFELDMEHLSGAEAASAVTFDLPRYVRVFASGPVPIIDYGGPARKKHWWQLWK